MSSEEQGYNDFWHYDAPRQPDNPDYMLGWEAGWDQMLEENDDDFDGEAILDDEPIDY